MHAHVTKCRQRGAHVLVAYHEALGQLAGPDGLASRHCGVWRQVEDLAPGQGAPPVPKLHVRMRFG